MASRFVRKVRTASGAVAVQVVTRRGRVVEHVEHVGSAHTDAELAVLLQVAGQLLVPGQGLLDLGEVQAVPVRMDDVADWTNAAGAPAVLVPDVTAGPGAAPMRVRAGGRLVSTSADLLWTVLASTYARLGFEVLDDAGFKAMVLARIIEPTSKAEVVRVLTEVGAPCPSLRTLFRSLTRCQARDYRATIARAAWAHALAARGPVALVMYDVTVRHEALVARLEVRDRHRGCCRSSGREAEGSLAGETSGWVGAALTKPCRVSTVRWRGLGERAGEVYARNRRHHLS